MSLGILTRTYPFVHALPDVAEDVVVNDFESKRSDEDAGDHGRVSLEYTVK